MEDNTIDISRLKDQGFTDEDLKQYIPKDETVPEVVNPVDTNDKQVEVNEEVPPPDSVIVEVEPHADNLKAALKEERDKRKVMAAELAALKAQYVTNQQTTPVQQTIPQQTIPSQQVSIIDQIAKFADEKVRQSLNITESIDTLQYSDPALYLKYVKNVAKEEFRLESDYEKQTEVYNQNHSFANELRSQQDFPTLYQFAIAELDELPGKKSRVIEQAFNKINQGTGSKEDIETIRNYTTECRVKMSGVNKPESIVTPVVDSTGSPLDKAIGLPRATNLSGAKTAAMSWSQVEDLIRQGKSDQIPKEIIAQIDPRLLL